MNLTTNGLILSDGLIHCYFIQVWLYLLIWVWHKKINWLGMDGHSWVQTDWVRNICGYIMTGKQERLLPLFFNLTRWRGCFVFVMVRQFYLLNSTDNVLEKYQTVNQEHFQNEIISELLLEVDFLPLNDLTVKMAFRNYVFNWFYSFLRAKSHDAVICIWKSRKAAKVNKLKVEKDNKNEIFNCWKWLR